LVTLGGKTATFQVNVNEAEAIRNISVTIGLPATNQEPEIFGVPEGGIKLSAGKNNDLPDRIVISAAGQDANAYPVVNGVYSYNSVRWYVDGTSHASSNIMVIKAEDYTLKIPHYITFVGTRDGAEYSRTITFTVEQ
jgi:hypothetical protein